MVVTVVSHFCLSVELLLFYAYNSVKTERLRHCSGRKLPFFLLDNNTVPTSDPDIAPPTRSACQIRSRRTVVEISTSHKNIPLIIISLVHNIDYNVHDSSLELRGGNTN